MRVIITISEPWDLGEAMHWQAIPGQLVGLSHEYVGGRALIKLDASLGFGNAWWPYLIGAPRHVGEHVDSLKAGAKIAGTFTGITMQQATSEKPFDNPIIRGGVAFIGEMEASDTPYQTGL